MIRKFYLQIGVVLIGALLLSSGPAQAVSLTANFKLYGELNRLNTLGYGGLGLSVALDGTKLAQGSIIYSVTEAPTTSGVLSSLTVPSTGWQVVDVEFAVPLTINLGQPASLSLELKASAIRLIYDFANDITFPGSLIGNTGEQGLLLTSLTMADGTPLDEAGLQWSFIYANTLEQVTLSVQGPNYSDTKHPPEIAQVNKGITRGSAGVEPIVKLSACPEPNPLVVDFCNASIGGTDNLQVTAIPLPGAIWLLSSGLLGLGTWRYRGRKG
jgi:hypothetical protein